MKPSRLIFLVLGLFAIALPSVAQTHLSPKSAKGLQSLDQGFVENKGQWDSRVQFLMHKPGMDMWLTKDGAVFDLKKTTQKCGKGKAKVQGDVVKMSFVGAENSSDHGMQEEKGYFNYFIGNDPKRWASHVRRFSEVRTSEIYRGIVLRYYTENGSPRYDLIVHPGADPSQVAMKFDGAQDVRIAANGDLMVNTPFGTLKEKGLVAYQEIGSKKVEVACHLTSKGGVAKFVTGSYDTSRNLVIDPLISSTYYFNFDSAYNTYFPETYLATAKDGGIAIATTDCGIASMFPATDGSYESTFYGPQAIVLAKMNAACDSLEFATYLGEIGSGTYSYPCSLLLDGSGNFTIPGTTDSTGYPTTSGAYTYSQPPGPNNPYFVFVSKVSPDGTALVRSALLDAAVAQSCCFDPSGNVWVAGQTVSQNYPGYVGDPFFGSGMLWELSTDFSKLLWKQSIFTNSTTSTQDEMYESVPLAIAPDGKGSLYVAGENAYNFANVSSTAASSGAAFTTGSGFLIHFNPSTHTTTSITALPVAVQINDLSPLFMVVNSAGEPIIATENVGGATTSATSYQQSNHNSKSAVYVATLSADLTQVLSSTYLGGSKPAPFNTNKAADTAAGLTLDSEGNVIVLGETSSFDFPVTTGAVLAQLPADAQTSYGFISKFNPSLSSLVYSSILHTGNILSCTLANDEPWIAGYKSSPGYFATPGAFMEGNIGDWGSTLSQISLTTGTTIAFSAQYVTGGSNVTCTVSIPSAAPTGGLNIPLAARSIAAWAPLNTPPANSIPSSITIPAGSKSASFTVAPTGFEETYDWEILAEFPGGYQTALLPVLPPQIKSVTANPSTLTGGTNTVVQVTLTAPAPPNFWLYVSTWYGPNITLNFKPGATTASVTMSTPQSNTNTTQGIPVYFGQYGEVGSQQASATLNILADPFIFSMNNATCVAGSSVNGTVTLPAPAPSGGQKFTFVSGTPSIAAVPATLTCPAGSKTLTVPVHTVGAQSTTVTITATSNGLSLSSSFSVAAATLSSMVASASTVPANGQITCKIGLNGWAPPGGAVVYLDAYNTPLTVPATCIIPAEQQYATFTITGAYASNSPVTVLAGYQNVGQSVAILVTAPVGATALTFSSPTIVGGQTQTGTVTLASASTTATTVILHASNAVGNLPASVVVPAGTTSAKFTFTPSTTSAAVLVSVTATALGGTASGSFTVNP